MFLKIVVIVLLVVRCVLVCFAQSETTTGVTAATAQAEAEDLFTPSLATSHLRAEGPEVIEKTAEGDYIREWVTVQWRPDDPIYLYVVRPRDVVKPPVIIYLYDYPAETDIYRDDEWCRSATAGGYAAVGFVPALNGQRYHGRPMKEWFVSELQESLGKSAHDVQMVLNYLAQRGDFNMDRVGIFGAGAGGTIAIAAASVDARIKAIDLLDPWGDWPDWMRTSEVIPESERATYSKPEFLRRVAAFDPVALLPMLKTRRVRLTQLDENATSSPAAAQQRIQAVLPTTAEARHFRDAKELFASGLSFDSVQGWLKQQLRPPRHSEIPKIP